MPLIFVDGEYNGLGGVIVKSNDMTVTSGLMAWLKSDAGITKDGSDLVSVWANQAASGSNYDFVQSTDTNKPLWTANHLNGYPGIVFNGSDNKMTISTSGQDILKNVPGASLFVVWKSANTGVNQQVVFMRDGHTTTRWYPRIALKKTVTDNYDSGQGERLDGTGSVSAVASTAPGTGAIVSTVLTDYVEQDVYLYRGGTLVASNINAGTGGNTSNTNAYAGSGLGYYPENNNEWLNGAIYEVLLYQRTVNGTERASIENYLKTRYAL